MELECWCGKGSQWKLRPHSRRSRLCWLYALQVGEFEFYRDQLWTAPELLRIKTPPVNGTQKADVYSFAIILQEIIYRATPYFIDVDDPKGMHRMCWRVLAFRQNSSKICNSPLLAAKT